jgi:uncharacterized protein (TIGR02001 family)
MLQPRSPLRLCALSSAVLAGATLIYPISSHAATSAWDSEISANVGLVSEYSFRGIAQSDEGPAVQGGFDIAHSSGLYAGIWGSNVDFNDGDEATVEMDVYAGYSGAIDSFNYDIGAIYYAYPGANSSLDYDFYELSLALGYDFDMFALSGSVNYSPEFFGDSGDAVYYAGAIDIPLPKDFSLNGHVGYQTIDDNAAFGVPDYMDWSVGLGYSWEGFDLSLSYIDTDLTEPGECADGCDERVIFGISKSF